MFSLGCGAGLGGTVGSALIGLGNGLRGMSRARATGLAAVAGGLAETFAVCGIGAIFIGQATATLLTAAGILARRLDAKTAFPACRYA